MVNFTRNSDSFNVSFEDSKHYLFGSGQLSFPFNSLIMILDDSEMVSFQKAETNDNVFSVLISELQFEGMQATRQNIEQAFNDTTMSSGGGGGGGTIDAYTKTQTDALLEEKQEVFQVNSPMSFNRNSNDDLELSIDLTNYATANETATLHNEVNELYMEVEQKADKATTYTVNEIDAKFAEKPYFKIEDSTSLTTSSTDGLYIVGNGNQESNNPSSIQVLTVEDENNYYSFGNYNRNLGQRTYYYVEDATNPQTASTQFQMTVDLSYKPDVMITFKWDGSEPDKVPSALLNGKLIVYQKSGNRLEFNLNGTAFEYRRDSYTDKGIAFVSPDGGEIDLTRFFRSNSTSSQFTTEAYGYSNEYTFFVHHYYGDNSIEDTLTMVWNGQNKQVPILEAQNAVNGSSSNYIWSSGISALNTNVISKIGVSQSSYTATSTYDISVSLSSFFWNSSEANTTIQLPLALNTTSTGKVASGLMSGRDKYKLDNLSTEVVLTQAEYDALETKDENTLYFIVEE